MCLNTDATQSDLLVALCQAASEPEPAPAIEPVPCAGDELFALLAQAAEEQEDEATPEPTANAEQDDANAQEATCDLEESLEQLADEPGLSEWAKFIQAKASAPIVAMQGPAPTTQAKTPKGDQARTPKGGRFKTPPKRSKTPEKRTRAAGKVLKKLSVAEMQSRSMRARQHMSTAHESHWDLDCDFPVSTA